MGAETTTERPEGRVGPLREHPERPWTWSLARQIALTRAEWSCEICGIPDWYAPIEVHHVTPVEDYDPGPQHDPDGLIVLCRDHHVEIHRAYRSSRDYQLALFVAA